MIVYPSAQFPTREVIYADSDYLRETQLQQTANSHKSQASFSYDTQLGREAKVITHNKFGPKIQQRDSGKASRHRFKLQQRKAQIMQSRNPNS